MAYLIMMKTSLIDNISKANKKTKNGMPSNKNIKRLIEHYRKGQYDEAEKQAVLMTQQFPSFMVGWKVLGTVLLQKGRVSDALLVNEKAVALSPQDVENHNSLGDNLRRMGKLDLAEASFKQAIALKPDFAEAHNNLGITLKELGKLNEAEVSFRKAMELKPTYANAMNSLGITLKELGRIKEAFSASIQAISLKPNFTEAYVNFSLIFKNLSFKSSEPRLYPILINLLKTNIIRPMDLARSISTLVKNDSIIKDLLDERDITSSLKKATSIIENLNKLKLLHELMVICPLPDIKLEGLFVKIRRFLLENLDKLAASVELDCFLSTLSLHCFTNEYVYFECEEESELVKKLEVLIQEAITKSKQPEVFKILCLASYRPLHKYSWCQKLKIPNHLEEIKKGLLKNHSLKR
jgi:hypothetical protein